MPSRIRIVESIAPRRHLQQVPTDSNNEAYRVRDLELAKESRKNIFRSEFSHPPLPAAPHRGSAEPDHHNRPSE